MARSKSVLGSKTSRTSATEQTAGDGVHAPDVNAAAGEVPSAEPRPEVRATPEAKASPAPKGTAEPRKLEVVKGDVRKNVVPINLEDEIRQRAFELFQKRGAGPGSEAEDWLNAEREVRQRYRQQSA